MSKQTRNIGVIGHVELGTTLIGRHQSEAMAALEASAKRAKMPIVVLGAALSALQDVKLQPNPMVSVIHDQDIYLQKYILEFLLIRQKKSNLPRKQRDYIERKVLRYIKDGTIQIK